MNLPLPTISQSSLPDALASVALLSTLVVVWWATGRTLKARDNLTPQIARRWTANVRNGLILIAIIGLLMIWAPQLRTFALSVTAVAVAIVIATKELILCLSGSAFRTFTRAYTIGDIVQIGEHRGEVLDISLLSTRMRETDRREGSIRPLKQAVIIPHSLLFSQPARVLARNGTAAQHGFDLVFEGRYDLLVRREELAECAARALAQCTGNASGDAADRPMIGLSTTELGRVRVEVSIKTTPEQAADAEAAIIHAIGSLVILENRSNDP